MTLHMPTKAAEEKRKSTWLSYLSLFTSLGTVLCCALPSLLVLFGLGATVSSFLTAVPSLVILSRHKAWTFAIAGPLIASDFLYVYAFAPRLKMQGEACSVEDGPTACDTSTRLSRVTLWVATVIYAIGFLTAYLLGPILARTN